MRKAIHAVALAIAVPVLFSSCATIFGKSSYPFSIDTRPEGAQVIITDKKNKEIFKGKTPAALRLKSSAGFFSRAEYQVRLSAPGYDERVIPVNFKLNGWYFGNLLIGGLVGMLIIDPASGAMWKLDTQPIDAVLNQTLPLSKSPSLEIRDVSSLSKEMKDKLIRIN